MPDHPAIAALTVLLIGIGIIGLVSTGIMFVGWVVDLFLRAREEAVRNSNHPSQS